MKKQLIIILSVTATGLSLGAARAAAQGPQGAGAGAATVSSTAKDSSHSSHSLNPVKWVKKDSKTSASRLEADSDRDKKLTAKLQSQGLLPANIDVKNACLTIKSLNDCVAALHASQNVGVEFRCLKWDLSGVQTGADMSGCKGPEKDKGMSLGKAIHINKRDANAKAEAKNAEKQAQADLKASGS